MRTLLVVIAFCSLASAQTIRFDAGSSSLFGGDGAGVTMYLPNNQVSLSGGLVNGHVTAGLTDVFKYRRDIVTAGTQQFGAGIDGGAVGFQGIGVSVQRRNDDRTVGFFVGSAGVGYSLPYFQGTTPQHLAFVVYYQRKIGRLRLGSLQGIEGGQKTSLGSVSYAGTKVQGILSGGLLSNNKYISGSATYSPIQSLHLVAAHQDYFVPMKATSNTVGAFANVSRWTASAMVIQGSSTTGPSTMGYTAGAGTTVSFFSVNANYYRYGQQSFTNYTATEHIGFRYTLTQTVTQGQTTSVNFGGGYTSNRFSASIGQAVLFLPFGQAGFQRVTTVSTSFRIHAATASLSTYIPSHGQLKYTAYGSDFVKGPLDIQGGPRQPQFHAGGKYIVRAVVKNTRTGAVVEGCAVQVGQQMVFSNNSGVIFTRTKKAQAVSVRISPDDFTIPGRWRVVHAPETATPSVDGQPFEILIENF